MELITLGLATAILLIIYFWFRGADPRLPPSPIRPLPVVGHLLFMASDFRPQFKEWGKQCGDIYSLYMGGTLVVVLNGFDLIKEALVKKADVFSDRPCFFINKASGFHNHGVIFASGDNWKEQRTVSLSILRSFGMGKNIMADKIEEEVGFYVKYLTSLKGQPADIRTITNVSTSNIICSILIGSRFEYDDQKFQSLIHDLFTLVSEQQNVSVINFVPWLRYIPGDLFKIKKLVVCAENLLDHLRKLIDEHRGSLENSSEASNLIEAYFCERNKKIKDGLPTFLDDHNLLKLLTDLFITGTETTSSTIYWCVLYMLHNPGVQEKVYQEIKEKIGVDRNPTMQDRTQLTYLNAVIAETQRLASIVPLSITHMTSEAVTLKGFTIPKGTFIIPNLDSVLHDTTTWGEDAMSFRPERFIDTNGDLEITDQFIPFGIGRRVCLAEAMAKMELFLFLANMFQKLQFLPPSPDRVHPLSYECGIVSPPTSYEVRIIERV